MKIIGKLSVVTFLLVAIFTSCTDEIERDPSPAVNSNNTGVYFLPENVSAPVLSIDQNSFEILIGRKKSTQAQTLSISAESVYDSIFSIPSSVTFKAGEDTVKLVIGVKKMMLMKTYRLALALDYNQTNPYETTTLFPRVELNVLKEDFATFAHGVYTSDFFGTETTSTLEYSPSKNLYRLKSCWGFEGYDVLFSWDGKNKGSEVVVNGAINSSNTYVIVKTGYIHSKYGMISAYYPLTNKNYYNSTTKTFTFPIKWVVSAGSFGVDNDTFVITD